MWRLCLLAFALILTGCKTIENGGVVRKEPRNILLKIQPGCSQEELEALFKAPARHEFTALRNNVTNRCVCYYFPPSGWLQYYFVFTNSALERITLAPVLEQTVDSSERHGGLLPVWKTHSTDERMEVVLNAPALTHDNLKTCIAFDSCDWRSHNPNIPAPVVAVFLVLGGPLILAAVPKRTIDNRVMQSLARRFDPSRARLGMTTDETEKLFGPPQLVEAGNNGAEMQYYGSQRFGVDYPEFWLAVSFQDKRAIGVFTDEFFDKAKLRRKDNR